jgi:RNA polymerase sigma-70 factor (ECF subfamily)
LASRHNIESEIAVAQERSRLAEALATLSEKERAAIVLRDIEGLETKEVARLLGTSQATVRSQISQARVKIKKYLDRALKRS